jgi:hypothetical protein
MNDFKKPVRLIKHPGNDFVFGYPEGFVADLKTPESKIFEVSSEKTFDVDLDKVTAPSAQAAAQEHGSKLLSAFFAVKSDGYLTVYVRDPEGVVTAWVVTAHIETTYSAMPGAL